MTGEADGVHGDLHATSGKQIKLTSMSSCAG